jgi:hypothetical protein
MHPASTVKNWSHHLHDDKGALWHGIAKPLHSQELWIWIGLAMLFSGLLALIRSIAQGLP